MIFRTFSAQSRATLLPPTFSFAFADFIAFRFHHFIDHFHLAHISLQHSRLLRRLRHADALRRHFLHSLSLFILFKHFIKPFRSRFAFSSLLSRFLSNFLLLRDFPPGRPPLIFLHAGDCILSSISIAIFFASGRNAAFISDSFDFLHSFALIFFWIRIGACHADNKPLSQPAMSAIADAGISRRRRRRRQPSGLSRIIRRLLARWRAIFSVTPWRRMSLRRSRPPRRRCRASRQPPPRRRM